jgi:hypothetical protein
MTDLVIRTNDLPDLTVAQIANLPQVQLQELDGMLGELQSWLKAARERMNTALEQRYGAHGRAALLDSGRDFGVAHLADGPLRVTFELPKRTAWDQKQLAAIAERIVAGGERVQDYMDVELSVSETRFNNWPPVLKEQFAAARTVKAGKPGFRLACVGEDLQ